MYMLGYEDDGKATGISPGELSASIKTLRVMVEAVGANIANMEVWQRWASYNIECFDTIYPNRHSIPILVPISYVVGECSTCRISESRRFYFSFVDHDLEVDDGSSRDQDR